MYAKIFRQIYNGTLVENWEALVTFQQFLVLADADGVVDYTPKTINRITGIPEKIIEKGIKVLEAPDPESRSAEHSGRRIIRLDDHRQWGWFIPTYDHYKNLKDSDSIRAGNRERKRKQRERERNRNKSVTGNVTGVTKVTDSPEKSRYTDTDTDTNTDTDIKKKKPFVETETEFQLSSLLLNLILKRKPDFKKPDLQKWSQIIDRMIRIDKRDPERIRQIIELCQVDDFWQNNILSTKKLRDQFDQLELKFFKREGKVTGRKALDQAFPD